MKAIREFDQTVSTKAGAPEKFWGWNGPVDQFWGWNGPVDEFWGW